MAKQQVFIDFDPTKAQIKTVEFAIQDRNRVFFCEKYFNYYIKVTDACII